MVALAKETRRFRRDRGGNAALAFGLALVPMIGVAGLVLDLQAAGDIRQVLQSEADAALLEVLRAAAQIETSAANATKTQAERSAMVEERAAAILSSRQAIARSRIADRAIGVSMAGGWEDPLKTEYTFTASGNVKRYFTFAGIGGAEPNLRIKISASAKMDAKTSASTSVPSMANPGHEAGDDNRLHASCYDDAKKNDASRNAAR